MNIKKTLVLGILACAASGAYATGGGNSWYDKNHDCNPPSGGGGGCVVTWDFTDNATAVTGDQTGGGNVYPNTGNYTLVVHGFTVGANTMYNPSSVRGQIGDGDSTYATDLTGSDYGVGVHAPGESAHWGTKIDNLKTDSETNYLRDAILLDFGSCLVSVDQIGLKSIYDTDFELWAYTGDVELVGNDDSVIPQIPDYDTWSVNTDWSLVSQNSGGSYDRTADINSSITSRYFVLIAGKNGGDYNNDAFRMMNLTVTCDPNNCQPGTPPTGVPVPGTLALLGIGALATRRRFAKLS
ncbi:MAG: PEP-CTERM sorting domain-containing protein [Gammaproteobacteria bacterium]|nr:PEP-CTERM sorting domain-containing protein [Gammaproteobacteria bacterium]